MLDEALAAVVANERAEEELLAKARGQERAELEVQALELARLGNRVRARRNAGWRSLLSSPAMLGVASVAALSVLWLLLRLCRSRGGAATAPRVAKHL